MILMTATCPRISTRVGFFLLSLTELYVYKNCLKKYTSDLQIFFANDKYANFNV